MSRLKPTEPTAMTAAQRRVYDEINSGPRGRVRGPFPVLLRVPEICEHIQRLGAFLRFGSSLSRKVIELVTIITARWWDCRYEWAVHAKYAREAGTPDAAIDAVRRRERPGGDAEAALVWDLATELLERHRLSPAAYARGVEAFGEEGMLEFVATVGYYAMLAQVLNGFEVVPDPDSPDDLPEPAP